MKRTVITACALAAAVLALPSWSSAAYVSCPGSLSGSLDRQYQIDETTPITGEASAPSEAVVAGISRMM